MKLIRHQEVYLDVELTHILVNQFNVGYYSKGGGNQALVRSSSTEEALCALDQ